MLRGGAVACGRASLDADGWEVEVVDGLGRRHRLSAESRLALAHNATRVVLVEIGVARPTGRAEAKAKVAASARDWEEEEVMTVEL